MNEILMISLSMAGFVVTMLVGHRLIKNSLMNNDIFSRNSLEDAMRIKARQFESVEDPQYS